MSLAERALPARRRRRRRRLRRATASRLLLPHPLTSAPAPAPLSATQAPLEPQREESTAAAAQGDPARSGIGCGAAAGAAASWGATSAGAGAARPTVVSFFSGRLGRFLVTANGARPDRSRGRAARVITGGGLLPIPSEPARPSAAWGGGFLSAGRPRKAEGAARRRRRPPPDPLLEVPPVARHLSFIPDSPLHTQHKHIHTRHR